MARRVSDPENRGVSYKIKYGAPEHGPETGRIYHPFTDAQLAAAVRKEFVYPGSQPPGLLPSITGQPPIPFVGQYRQYLDQANSTNPQASSPSAVRAGPPSPVSPANRNSSGNDIAAWVASLAGVDARNPAQSLPQQTAEPRGIWSNEPMEHWSVQPPIHFPF